MSTIAERYVTLNPKWGYCHDGGAHRFTCKIGEIMQPHECDRCGMAV